MKGEEEKPAYVHAFEIANRSLLAAGATAARAREAERRAAAAMDAAHALAAEDRAPVGTASLARVRAERAHAAWRAAEGAALEAEAWARATYAAFEGMLAVVMARPCAPAAPMRR